MAYGISQPASGWFGSRGRGAVPVAMPSLRGRGQCDVRRAAELGRLGVAKFQVHIFRHGGGSRSGRVAGAEITVDVVARQAGVLERAERNFGMELRHRLVRRVPRRMLE